MKQEKSQRRNRTGQGREVTKSIQLKSYLKVYFRVYICIAVSIHTNAQIPVAGRGCPDME